MRTHSLQILGLSALWGLLAFGAEAEIYKIEPRHTSVVASYSHFGLSHPTMKFMGIEGQLDLDPDHPESAKLELSLDLNTLSSGLAEFDTELKGPGYFDTSTYPSAHYMSQSVEITGPESALVHGILSLHGQTHPLDLIVHYNKKAFNPALFKTGLGFSALGHLNRSDYGLGAFSSLMGSDVDLSIEAEVYP